MYNTYPTKITNYSSSSTNPYYYSENDDRFFFAPFLVGGLAGTALGYGLANNNQIHNQPYYPMVPMYPMYSYPTYSSNYYYY